MTQPLPITPPFPGPVLGSDRAAWAREEEVMDLRRRVVPLLWADLERSRASASSSGDGLVAAGLVGLAVGIAAGLRRFR